MKKKRIWKGILLGVLGALLLAVLLQIGWSGKYTGSDGKYLPITASDSWSHIYNHPVWEENGKEMFSIWGDSRATDLTSFMSVRALSLWCGWNADEIVDGFNALLEAANRGDFSIHSVYSEEESDADPHCNTHGSHFIGVSPESRLRSWRQAAAISKSYL